MLEIDASEIERHGDCVDRILRREIFGVLVRNVFPREQLARVIARLQGDASAPVFESHTFRGRTYGRVLRMAGETLDEYFDAAASMGRALAAAFGEEPTYETRLRELLTALGGGRAVSTPSHEGRAYAPATVRVIEPGGVVDLHCGNETHRFPALRHLTQVIDPAGEISTLVPLAMPEEGGALDVYDVCFGDPLIAELDHRLGRERAHEELGARRRLRLRPAVGDVALFEEGRHYHRVDEVRGPRARWTLGGFVAPSRDGLTLHYWS
ncbi:hypothetical protein [Sandaracinus amylolyticus]|uniref:2OG-Fe(II)-dependent halogenase WelO5 family protein n=1 Tax=Sandaracinus amylolyticus TaxID=927083 RepID=UPI001F48176D|nr:hypothetical protein [Sandaracinus amylolyticus]UJR84379.1 Hypothetical protein I5071_64580 [Sandaracinus amylolyticus]